MYGGVTNFDTDGVSGEAASAASDLAGRIDVRDICLLRVIIPIPNAVILGIEFPT